MEGRMEGKRGRGRMTKVHGLYDGGRYGKLKEKAKHREEWSRTFGPAGRQMT